MHPKLNRIEGALTVGGAAALDPAAVEVSGSRLRSLCLAAPFYQAPFGPFALDPSPDPEPPSIGFGTGDANPSAYQWGSASPAPSTP